MTQVPSIHPGISLLFLLADVNNLCLFFFRSCTLLLMFIYCLKMSCIVSTINFLYSYLYPYVDFNYKDLTFSWRCGTVVGTAASQQDGV